MGHYREKKNQMDWPHLETWWILEEYVKRKGIIVGKVPSGTSRVGVKERKRKIKKKVHRDK
jgi:hypothetical protein